MSSISAGRFSGIATVLLGVTLALAAIAIVAQVAASPIARALGDGDSTMEGGQDAVVGGRLSGVLAQARRSGIPPETNLGVILGSSSVGMDLDPNVLEEEAGPRMPARWLSLYANGANIE